jgi:integrase/recombinase XerD
MDLLSARSAVPSSDPLSTSELFKRFFVEPRFLKDVTSDTLQWYDTAWKALCRTLGPEPALTKATLQQFVVALRQRDLKPVSCNTYIRAMNAFCRWLHDEGHHANRLELPLLKLEKRVLQTLTDDQINALLSWKPKRFDHSRLHALIALVLDTGVRIEEALTVRVSNVDCDNLLVTVFGKGRKERRVPFSFELRKVLYRWERARSVRCPRCELLFPSREGTTWDQLARAASVAEEAQSADVRLASPAPHVRDERPPQGRRYRPLVDGARAHADHDDATLPAPADGGSQREPPEGVDPESAWVIGGRGGRCGR